MGEYATYGGEQVKIGTCEDLYYLRHDQRFRVGKTSNSLNPCLTEGLRFRFPFPDEDNVSPGEFEDYNRSLSLHGVIVPDDVDHGKVQFSAQPGYLVSLPCPEAGESEHYQMHRNGFPGGVGICQQREHEGKLLLIAVCNGCGTKFNLPTLEDAQPFIDACKIKEQYAIRDRSTSGQEFWSEMAKRIIEGYQLADVVKSVGDSRKSKCCDESMSLDEDAKFQCDYCGQVYGDNQQP